MKNFICILTTIILVIALPVCVASGVWFTVLTIQTPEVILDSARDQYMMAVGKVAICSLIATIGSAGLRDIAAN